MIGKVSSKAFDLSQIESDLRAMSGGMSQPLSEAKDGKSPSFADLLKQGIGEVNAAVKQSEKSSMDLAAGKSTNIHETMLAVSKAELGFNMLVQLRNKALEAYQEVMRMQV
jgi:flagellar hook-basal body complex protein FliE